MAIGIFNQQKYITASDKALAFIQSQMSLHSSGHLPVSYLVPGPPTADPLWNLSSPSSGVPYIYKAQQRCWIDSAGLALLVLTTSGDYVRCKVIMNKMQSLPKSGGGFYSSYDVVEGHLGNDIPVHTGKIAWLVWGMCYYAIISGDSSFSSMINAAGTWLLGRQVNDINDKRHGLLKGGFDENGEIQWCSTENNLSALQALQGLYSLTNDSNYINAANLIIDRLKPTPVLSSQPSLYFGGQNRYYQGVNAVKLDDGLALDCTTWAGATAKNLLPDSGILPNRDTIASNCRSTAYSNFLATSIYTLSGVYGGYSLNSAVKGFKPFANSGDPSFIWSEGTLGYVHLCLLLNENQAALEFMNETLEMQNCKAGQNGVLYSTHRITAQDTEFRIWENVVSSAWLYLLINNPVVLFPRLPLPVISGANTVDHIGSQFTLLNPPPGETIYWTVNDGTLTVVPSGNPTTVTQFSVGGPVTLSAHIGSPTGMVLATKKVTPADPVILGPSGALSPSGTFSVSAYGTFPVWFVPNGFSLTSTSNSGHTAIITADSLNGQSGTLIAAITGSKNLTKNIQAGQSSGGSSASIQGPDKVYTTGPATFYLSTGDALNWASTPPTLLNIDLKKATFATVSANAPKGTSGFLIAIRTNMSTVSKPVVIA